MTILIPVLFMLCFTGLGYVLVSSFLSGAEIYSGTYSEETSKQFEDVFLFIPPKNIADAAWALAATTFLSVFFITCGEMTASSIAAGLILGGITGSLALKSPRLLLAILKKRRLTRFNLQLVDALVGMSNALKAGFSINQAFESIVKDGDIPISQEFDVCLQETRVGVNFSDALANLEQRVHSDDLTLVVMAIETARKTGGNLTEIFERISGTIRERMRIENRIQTLTAQGKMQGIVLGCMPVVIGIAVTIVDPQVMLPFIRSHVGVTAIVIVAALILCGALVIRKIVDIEV